MDSDSEVDRTLLQDYISALRAARDPATLPHRERAEQRAASCWFAMDGPTQRAALSAAQAEGLVPSPQEQPVLAENPEGPTGLKPHDVVRDITSGTCHEVLEVRPSQIVLVDPPLAWIHPSKCSRVAPRVDRHGLTVYPVARQGSLFWVTIPEE